MIRGIQVIRVIRAIRVIQVIRVIRVIRAIRVIRVLRVISVIRMICVISPEGGSTPLDHSTAPPAACYHGPSARCAHCARARWPVRASSNKRGV